MAAHWVSYDLNKAGQNYSGLIDYLKSHQSWAKPLKSSFFVQTTLNAVQLRDEILPYVDSNDGVVVVTVTGELWATYGIPDDVGTWMQNNI